MREARPDLFVEMLTYFRLKDERGKMKQRRSEFMKTYECKNKRQDSPFEPPTECIYLSYDEPKLDSEACEPCKTRHAFYLTLKANGRRRGAITRKINRELNKPLPF